MSTIYFYPITKLTLCLNFKLSPLLLNRPSGYILLTPVPPHHDRRLKHFKNVYIVESPAVFSNRYYAVRNIRVNSSFELRQPKFSHEAQKVNGNLLLEKRT